GPDHVDGVARARGEYQPRPGAGRQQQRAEPHYRDSLIRRRSGAGRSSGHRVHPGRTGCGDPDDGQAFPRARGHARGLAPGPAGGPKGSPAPAQGRGVPVRGGHRCRGRWDHVHPHRLSCARCRPSRLAVASEEHRRQAQEIADRAVTLVSNRARRIPLPSGRTAVLALTGDEGVDTAPDDRMASALRLGVELAQLMPGVTIAGDASQVVNHSWDNVVVASVSWSSSRSTQTLQALHQQFGERLVVVGAGNPYELLRIPGLHAYLAAYGPDPASMRAAAKILSGELEPT